MPLVSDIMTKDVLTVTKETSVRELAEIFREKPFGTLPVVDGDGNLVAVVTESDLIEQGRPLHIPTVISIFDWVIPLGGERQLQDELKRVSGNSVSDLCHESVITVAPDDDISAAAELMSTHRLHAVPVVEGRRLVGIVARIDIIRNLSF